MYGELQERDIDNVFHKQKENVQTFSNVITYIFFYVQVVTENLSTLYLTRPTGFPVISTDPPHAFILHIPEKRGDVVTQGLKFSEIWKT